MFGLSVNNDGGKCWYFCFSTMVVILVGNDKSVGATVEQNPTNNVTQELTTLLTSAAAISRSPTTAPTPKMYWGENFCHPKPYPPSFIDDGCFAMDVRGAGWEFFNGNAPHQYADCVERNTPIEFRLFVAICDYAQPESYSFALTGPADSNTSIAFDMNFPSGTSFFIQGNGPGDIIYKSDDGRFWVPGEYHFRYTYYCYQNQTGKVMYNLDTKFTINQYCPSAAPTISPSKSLNAITDQPTLSPTILSTISKPYSFSTSQPLSESHGQLVLYQQQNSSDVDSPFLPLRNLTEPISHVCIKKGNIVTIEYSPTSLLEKTTIRKVQFVLQGASSNRTFKKTEWSYPYLLYGNIDTKWYGRKWVRFHPYNLTVLVSCNSNLINPIWEVKKSIVIDAWC